MTFIQKFIEGHNSVRDVGRVTVSILCTSSGLMMLYVCTKFRENILNGFGVMERK